MVKQDLNLEKFIYEEDDLGATYNSNYTLFKIWAPIHEDVKVKIYDRYDDSEGKVYPMVKGENGLWELKLEGDFKNKYYNYVVTKDNMQIEVTDPYTKGATVNGTRGMIVDFKSIDPVDWEDHKLPKPLDPTESIIYEIHVRDFSIDKFSGMRNKGKYLALTEEGTRSEDGLSTGLEHLKELGVTHVHVLPIFDFASVDETKDGEYNWGYDPYLYNVPEGSYSTNPYDGTVRIRELKEMIKVLHENDIRIVMDVVFNHTYSVDNSPFGILAPKYYYRTDEGGNYFNGSGCGNEIASERPMVRKFILDSIKFWATEYKIDGFRFDLMALHDIETIKAAERELKKINPNCLIYGEPWTGGLSSLDESLQFKKGKQQGMNVAFFNDDFRNAIKGDNDGTGWGFVNGASRLKKEIKKGIVGSINYKHDIIGFAKEPVETINYVSSHDNLTLFDKIEKSNPNATIEEKIKMNRLALSIILTSQGIPFINGGSEILRTKKGHHNTYNAGDELNKIDWSRKSLYKDTFEYIRGLIEVRKSQKIMAMNRAEDIRKYLKFVGSPNRAVAYFLNSPYEEEYKHIFIAHNANRHEVEINLPIYGKWKVIANEHEVNIKGVYKGNQYFEDSVKVAPLSTYILYKN